MDTKKINKKQNKIKNNKTTKSTIQTNTLNIVGAPDVRGQNINGIITKPTLVSGSDIPSVSVDSDSSFTYLELSAEEDEAGNMDEEGLAGNIPR